MRRWVENLVNKFDSMADETRKTLVDSMFPILLILSDVTLKPFVLPVRQPYRELFDFRKEIDVRKFHVQSDAEMGGNEVWVIHRKIKSES